MGLLGHLEHRQISCKESIELGILKSHVTAIKLGHASPFALLGGGVVEAEALIAGGGGEAEVGADS